MLKKLFLFFSLTGTIILSARSPSVDANDIKKQSIVIFAQTSEFLNPEAAKLLLDSKKLYAALRASGTDVDIPANSTWVKIKSAQAYMNDSQLGYDIAAVTRDCAIATLKKNNIDVTKYSSIILVHDLVLGNHPLEIGYSTINLNLNSNAEDYSESSVGLSFIHFKKVCAK